MIKWKDNYNIGLDNIDEQHKKLFEIANTTYELLKNEFSVDKYDKIVQILIELKNYTIYHFQSEEEYMLSIEYKKFISHKAEHNDFIKKLNEVNLDNIDENQDKYLMETLEFVVNWITDHILLKDKLISQN